MLKFGLPRAYKCYKDFIQDCYAPKFWFIDQNVCVGGVCFLKKN